MQNSQRIAMIPVQYTLKHKINKFKFGLNFFKANQKEKIKKVVNFLTIKRQKSLMTKPFIQMARNFKREKIGLFGPLKKTNGN